MFINYRAHRRKASLWFKLGADVYPGRVSAIRSLKTVPTRSTGPFRNRSGTSNSNSLTGRALWCSAWDCLTLIRPSSTASTWPIRWREAHLSACLALKELTRRDASLVLPATTRRKRPVSANPVQSILSLSIPLLSAALHVSTVDLLSSPKTGELASATVLPPSTEPVTICAKSEGIFSLLTLN